MANVSSSNGLEKRPKLRFPGFDEPWKSKPFSSLYKYVNEKNDGSFSVDSIISVANMYFKPDARITDMEYLKTYNIFKLGDIAFEGNMSKDFSFGRFVENTIGDGIVSHVFVVFRPINNFHNFDYWKYAINNENVMGRILARCTKKTTMMTNLVTTDFLTQKIYCPSLEEQAHIASFLSLIDQRIRKQKELLNALKKYKRGLLNSLITQKLKFTSGQIWRTTKLGDIFQERTERAIGDEELLAVTISSGVQKRDEINLKDNSSDDKSHYKRVYKGDLVYNTMRMWQGASGVSLFDGIVSPAYTVVTPIDAAGTNIIFWSYYFKFAPLVRTFQKYSQGLTSDTWNLKFSRFSEIKVSVPSLKEQTAIAGVLIGVDRKIYDEEKKLTFIQKSRSSLMQQLFI